MKECSGPQESRTFCRLLSCLGCTRPVLQLLARFSLEAKSQGNSMKILCTVTVILVPLLRSNEAGRLMTCLLQNRQLFVLSSKHQTWSIFGSGRSYQVKSDLGSLPPTSLSFDHQGSLPILPCLCESLHSSNPACSFQLHSSLVLSDICNAVSASL